MVGDLGEYVIASPDGEPGRGVVVVRLGHTPDGERGVLDWTLGKLVAGLRGKSSTGRRGELVL
jgi:hypothetical protein